MARAFPTAIQIFSVIDSREEGLWGWKRPFHRIFYALKIDDWTGTVRKGWELDQCLTFENIESTVT